MQSRIVTKQIGAMNWISIKTTGFKKKGKNSIKAQERNATCNSTIFPHANESFTNEELEIIKNATQKTEDSQIPSRPGSTPLGNKTLRASQLKMLSNEFYDISDTFDQISRPQDEKPPEIPDTTFSIISRHISDDEENSEEEERIEHMVKTRSLTRTNSTEKSTVTIKDIQDNVISWCSEQDILHQEQFNPTSFNGTIQKKSQVLIPSENAGQRKLRRACVKHSILIQERENLFQSFDPARPKSEKEKRIQKEMRKTLSAQRYRRHLSTNINLIMPDYIARISPKSTESTLDLSTYSSIM